MALTRPTPVHATRRSTLSVVAITATLGLLIGCTPQGSVIPPVRAPITYPQADPGAEPRLGSTLGQEWTAISYPTGLGPDARYDAFSAGGSLWVYDKNNLTVLYGTNDGTTWREVDATKYGVSNDGELGAHWWLPPGRGTSVKSTFAVFYEPDSDRARNTLILEVGPDGASLSDSEKNGLDVMPPDEGGLKYRSYYPFGMQEIDGTRVIIGRGYWRSDTRIEAESLYTAFEGPTGVWSVQTPTEWPGDKEGVPPFSLTTVGDRIVVLTLEYENKSGPMAWSTADGLTWQKQELTGVAPKLLWGLSRTVSSTEHGIALWVNSGDHGENKADIWTSTDGLIWNHTQLLNEDWKLLYLQVEEDGFSAFVTGDNPLDNNVIKQVLYSPDGISWTSSPGFFDHESWMRQSISHEGGLVYLDPDEIKVTGLPWGAP